MKRNENVTLYKCDTEFFIIYIKFLSYLLFVFNIINIF